MTERFLKRVPLKWDFKETIGYADLYETDDGRIIAKAKIEEDGVEVVIEGLENELL